MARIVQARKELVALERQLASFELDESSRDAVEAACAAAVAAEIDGLEAAGSRRARAESILRDLKFSEAMMQSPVGHLSGGWRIRVALAMASFVEAQVRSLLAQSTCRLGAGALASVHRTLHSAVLLSRLGQRAFGKHVYAHDPDCCWIDMGRCLSMRNEGKNT